MAMSTRPATLIVGAFVAFLGLFLLLDRRGATASASVAAALRHGEAAGTQADTVAAAVADLNRTITASFTSALREFRTTASKSAVSAAGLSGGGRMVKGAAAEEELAKLRRQQALHDALPQQERALRDAQLRVNYSASWMSAPEMNLALRFVALSTNRVYLEWGGGGSTTNFAQFARERAYSIEHDAAWCAQIGKMIAASNGRLGRVVQRCVPVARGTGGWGRASPFEEGSYRQFSAYVDEIEKVGEKRFDIVLIDGRARMDCAIRALGFIDADSFVVLHDASRIMLPKKGGVTGSGASKSYAEVLEFYDVLHMVSGKGRQGIAILRRKEEFAHLLGNHAAVKELIKRRHGSNGK